MSAMGARPRGRGLTGHDPASYQPHTLHSPQRSYPESNCYSDVLIELLHARGHEPLAAFGHVVRLDFEGDQWTFFKPPPGDLELLFGVDIHEMQPYRPLPVQMAEQLAAGRTMIVELDAFHLPDTAATSYRRAHVKTSVAIEAIDPESETLHYFHGPGLYACTGEDYRGLLRLDGRADPEILPPYTELVRFDAGPAVPASELPKVACALLAGHLARRPADNPFERFGVQLAAALPDLLAGELEDYHAYAFATVRMAGSAFELAASHAEFALGAGAAQAAAALRECSEGCKALSFRLARRRAFEIAPRIEGLAGAWARAMAALGGALP
jgi:hypothetical protein